MSRLRGLTITDALQIPTGAGAGKVAVSDASGNLSWQQDPGWAATKNLVVQGPIAVPVGAANVLPPIFVSVPAPYTLALAFCRYVIQSGTSVTFNILRNGSTATGFTGLVATTTAGLTNPTDVSLADGDTLQVVVTAISGAPANLTVMLGLT